MAEYNKDEAVTSEVMELCAQVLATCQYHEDTVTMQALAYALASAIFSGIKKGHRQYALKTMFEALAGDLAKNEAVEDADESRPQ